MIERAQLPWMFDLMVACNEIAREDVEVLRHSQALAAGTPAVAASPSKLEGESAVPERPSRSAVADSPPGSIATGHAASIKKALAWATKLDDDTLIAGLVVSLPEAVLEEQLRLYEASPAVVGKLPKAPEKLLVHSHLLSSRMQAATVFDEYLRGGGWVPSARIPRNACPAFIKDMMALSKNSQLRNVSRGLRTWHRQWMKENRLQVPTSHIAAKHTGRAIEFARRQRQHLFQGRPFACPWLRQALFEWFTAARYSIDWKSVRASLRSGGGKKCLARFTRQLVRQKARQLLQDYCFQSLLQGKHAVGVQLTARWFSDWEADFGLSMRKANRKYKVPKAVMEERLEIAWCNGARVRALCFAVHGYEPEMENWDQSPFHGNESGSANVPTLAVAGGIVPLVEGHAATRERWTANLTTFSNKERLLQDGPPYAEFVFKAAGGILELKLREHIRSCGYGPWVSVATSDKGSYKTPDVLNFLETHLPPMSGSRRWRIIWADDFSAHLSPQVFRLCWSRGYVFMAHGGGVTPVTQTCDTDLNQPVKRDYIALETSVLLAQMRDGVSVPRCRPEQCIDMMVEVLSNIHVHIHAADGYLKTGMNVALDGTQDFEVVREAGDFWRDRKMRAKIDSAVAEVKAEVAAGRLCWSLADVQRVIRPYPKHKHVDAVLELQGDDTWRPEGDRAFVDDDVDTSAFGSDGESDEQEDARSGGQDATADADDSDAEANDPPDEHDARSGGRSDGAGDSAVVVSAASAEQIAHSAQLIATYESAISSLKACGAMKSVINLQNDILKERRRIRSMGREDGDVLLALAKQGDEEDARERKRRRAVADANAQTLNAAKLKRSIEDANSTLKKRKRAIQEAESLLEMKHAMKTFSAKGLGKGRSGGGGAPGKKLRLEVLDRLSRVGQGLSGAQKNDFGWWKNSWDAKMLEEHGEDWGGVFAEWAQRVLKDVEDGIGNAFSLFVHDETRRCFNEALVLRVP
jgi:hypothetical protein